MWKWFIDRATPIEYGLIAALLAVACIAAYQGLYSPDHQPVARNKMCAAALVEEDGNVLLDCPGVKLETARLSVNSFQLALAQSLRPRPMQCTLYRLKPADCILTRG